MRGLIGYIIPHGVIESIVRFDVQSMLFFHLLRCADNGTLLLYKGQYLMHRSRQHHRRLSGIADGHPFFEQRDPVIQPIMYPDHQTREGLRCLEQEGEKGGGRGLLQRRPGAVLHRLGFLTSRLKGYHLQRTAVVAQRRNDLRCQICLLTLSGQPPHIECPTINGQPRLGSNRPQQLLSGDDILKIHTGKSRFYQEPAAKPAVK